MFSQRLKPRQMSLERFEQCPSMTSEESLVMGHETDEITTLNACRIGGILSIEIIFSLKKYRKLVVSIKGKKNLGVSCT